MIICGPGFNNGEVVEELVDLLDIPPTILSAAGIPTPKTMSGRPLQELTEGNETEWRQDVYIQISESHVGRAIRTHKWKYSVRAENLKGNAVATSFEYTDDFLYDLEVDPHEKNNLIDDASYTTIRDELSKRLISKMISAGESVPTIKRLVK